MARAELGDDGWCDDPTVLELERVSASMLRERPQKPTPATIRDKIPVGRYGGTEE